MLELKSDVQISEQNIEQLQAKYIKEITELKNLIGNKSSIPKDQVYPKFDSLSQIYSQLLEEKNLAVLRRELFAVLLEYKDSMTNELTETLVRESKALYAEKATQLRMIEEHIAQTMKSEIVGDNIIREMPLNTPNFMHIPLDLASQISVSLSTTRSTVCLLIRSLLRSLFRIQISTLTQLLRSVALCPN